MKKKDRPSRIYLIEGSLIPAYFSKKEQLFWDIFFTILFIGIMGLCITMPILVGLGVIVRNVK